MPKKKELKLVYVSTLPVTRSRARAEKSDNPGNAGVLDTPQETNPIEGMGRIAEAQSISRACPTSSIVTDLSSGCDASAEMGQIQHGTGRSLLEQRGPSPLEHEKNQNAIDNLHSVNEPLDLSAASVGHQFNRLANGNIFLESGDRSCSNPGVEPRRSISTSNQKSKEGSQLHGLKQTVHSGIEKSSIRNVTEHELSHVEDCPKTNPSRNMKSRDVIETPIFSGCPRHANQEEGSKNDNTQSGRIYHSVNMDRNSSTVTILSHDNQDKTPILSGCPRHPNLGEGSQNSNTPSERIYPSVNMDRNSSTVTILPHVNEDKTPIFGGCPRHPNQGEGSQSGNTPSGLVYPSVNMNRKSSAVTVLPHDNQDKTPIFRGCPRPANQGEGSPNSNTPSGRVYPSVNMDGNSSAVTLHPHVNQDKNILTALSPPEIVMNCITETAAPLPSHANQKEPFSPRGNGDANSPTESFHPHVGQSGNARVAPPPPGINQNGDLPLAPFRSHASNNSTPRSAPFSPHVGQNSNYPTGRGHVPPRARRSRWSCTIH